MTSDGRSHSSRHLMKQSFGVPNRKVRVPQTLPLHLFFFLFFFGKIFKTTFGSIYYWNFIVSAWGLFGFIIENYIISVGVIQVYRN